jgi:hypothetical protein
MEPLSGIVKFFSLTSPWHDKGLEDAIEAFQEVNYGQYDEVLSRLVKLQLHITKAGRDRYGWNRTEVGEMVTAEKVYLGDIAFLPTRPVSYWAEQVNAPKNNWKGTLYEHDLMGMNAYDVVARQASNFIRSHMCPVINLITEIEHLVSR